MKSERSKSALKLPLRSLQHRVEGFISRQKSKEITESTPNFGVRKLASALTERSLVITQEECTLDLPETIRASAKALKDIKVIQEGLRTQLNCKSSYSASRILKKVNEKYKETQELIKTIENRSKGLIMLERSIDAKIIYLDDRERDLKTYSSLNYSTKDIDLTDFDTGGKHVSFEENCIENKQASLPQDRVSKSELKRLEAELQTKSEDLARIAQDLKERESKLDEEKLVIENKFSEIRKRERLIKSAEESLKKSFTEVERKIKSLDDMAIEHMCRIVIDDIISRAEFMFIENEKKRLDIFQDKLRRQLEDISVYETVLKCKNSKKMNELEMKEAELIKEEAKMIRQIKMLANGEHEAVVLEKLDEINKKESRLRAKHLDLLELKELLNEKEDELVQQKSVMNFIEDIRSDKMKCNLFKG